MNEFWIVAVLISGIILLAFLLPSEQAPSSPRVPPPADTLPDKPIPMEHEHGEEEDPTCGI